MFREMHRILAYGDARRVRRMLSLSLVLGVFAGGASVGLLALSGWFIAMSAVAGAGLAAGFSFFYPSAGVQALALVGPRSVTPIDWLATPPHSDSTLL